MSDDRERERHERRLERDRRRRAEGKPTYFDVDETTVESRPLLTDAADQPTMIIRPARLREEAARDDADELELSWGTLEEAETIAALEQDSFSGAETLMVPLAERPAPHEGAVPDASRRRLAVSTAIFAAATGLSRVLGLVREIVTANYFGVAGKVNAFTVAFQIPNLIRALVADAALSSAFVPVFSELLEKGERKRAWRVASSLFWLMLLGLTALTRDLHPHRAVGDGPLREPRRRPGAGGRTLARPLPDRHPARRLRNRRRDPQQLRRVHGAGDLAGLLEPRDHRRPRHRRARRRRR